MNFDVRDLTLPGWILTLLCLAVVAGVATTFGLVVWNHADHASIKSGLPGIILGGATLGVLAGAGLYAGGAALARSHAIPLARPQRRPNVGMLRDVWFMVTLFGLNAVVFGGITLYLLTT